ncbi:unnamed protein product [Prorocentrum cordatum]|uniref:Uncharacterized protein n=1 Tax=Prorocentrum cordatum TaxID=2364126 RepID=A0ABN9PBR7_9DINO|nr:unnamed protein product [Polarella glacialis]
MGLPRAAPGRHLLSEAASAASDAGAPEATHRRAAWAGVGDVRQHPLGKRPAPGAHPFFSRGRTSGAVAAGLARAVSAQRPLDIQAEPPRSRAAPPARLAAAERVAASPHERRGPPPRRAKRRGGPRRAAPAPRRKRRRPAPQRKAGLPLRPLVLCFADKRKHALQQVLPRWAGVLDTVGGSARKLSNRLGPDLGPRHQEWVLRRWSARTLQIHVANIEKFLAWASEERPGVDHSSFQDHDATAELLVRYVMDLLDGGAAPTVPAARLESLRFLNRAAGLSPPLPAGEVCVQHLALAHRREAPASARQPQIYTVEQIRMLERSATALHSPMYRVAIRTELRGMPWIAPLRGVSQPPSCWARGYSEDLEAKASGLHSAKRTILTWAGSSGIFTDREIEVLGHHRSSGIGKVVCACNVAVLAAPVTKLRQLLEHIVQGAFNPDAPAGMQWREGAYPAAQPAAPTLAAAPPRENPEAPASAPAAAPANGQAGAGAAPAPQPAPAHIPRAGTPPTAHAAAAERARNPAELAPLGPFSRPPCCAARGKPRPGGGRRCAAAAAAATGHGCSVVPSAGAGTRSGSSTVAPAVAWLPGETEATSSGAQRLANKLGYLVAETAGAPRRRDATRAVTNLCDFAVAQAKWSQQLPGPTCEFCKVCNSRLGKQR